MLRMLLSGLPWRALSTSFAPGRAEGQKRLRRWHQFYRNVQTPGDLKRAALCLRLVTHVLSLTAKGQWAECPEVPPLVVLGRGLVQQRTCDQLRSLLPSHFLNTFQTLTWTVLFSHCARLRFTYSTGLSSTYSIQPNSARYEELLTETAVGMHANSF